MAEITWLRSLGEITWSHLDIWRHLESIWRRPGAGNTQETQRNPGHTRETSRRDPTQEARGLWDTNTMILQRRCIRWGKRGGVHSGGEGGTTVLIPEPHENLARPRSAPSYVKTWFSGNRVACNAPAQAGAETKAEYADVCMCITPMMHDTTLAHEGEEGQRPMSAQSAEDAVRGKHCSAPGNLSTSRLLA